jgi:hypothetical protein
MRIYNHSTTAAQRACLAVALLSLASVPLPGSMTAPAQRRAGVLDFLYPRGTEAAPPGDVHLELPLRVAVAFVPESESGLAGFAPLRPDGAGKELRRQDSESDPRRPTSTPDGAALHAIEQDLPDCGGLCSAPPAWAARGSCA